MEGWIKLHRSLLESSQFADLATLKVWIWLLLKASIKTRNVGLKIGKGSQVINLKRGQLIFGRKRAAEDLGINENSIYRIIQELSNLGSISIDSNNQYSIISVLKYDDYQSNIEDDEFEIYEVEQPTNNQPTTNEQPTNSNPTTNQQRATHNKKVNKGEKVNKVKKEFTGREPVSEKQVTEHWKKTVDVWFTFYKSKFSIEPTFTGPAQKALKAVLSGLKKIADTKGDIWNEVNAEKYFTRFLTVAHADAWYQQNFLLPTLASKFDSIINTQINGKHTKKVESNGRTLEFDNA